ncbi:response regulator transcription factor [Leucobacter coleopterorum]|uniref:Response regulator transcription factor n=1 Tax=Leucobacter coleopterorum TaxID=2714933 RepID=A0ABX6JYB3_9MICO|nr:response regulator transcription factor [Leucobacter coleopterorum]QIM17775.1 response regulator transcription factor [Leucobacter coleopterorum]
MVKILLVDDHPVLRHGVRTLLDTQPDFEVVAEAGSLEEVSARLAALPVDVALVDLDLGPDKPGGIEVTSAIRRTHESVKVLIFTAYDSDADIVRAVEAGAAGYLVKDSRPADLFQAIRSAVLGSEAMPGAIAERLRQRGDRPLETLTSRELEVLTLAAKGLSNRELARKLVVSEATVKTHLHHASTKLGTENRQAAVAAAVKQGLIRI